MQSRTKILVVVASAAVLGSALIYRSSDHCGISEATAKSMVLAELSSSGFDPRFLGPAVRESRGCTYDIHYEGGGQKIDYAVYDDVMHGPELATWDFNKPGNGP